MFEAAIEELSVRWMTDGLGHGFGWVGSGQLFGALSWARSMEIDPRIR